MSDVTAGEVLSIKAPGAGETVRLPVMLLDTSGDPVTGVAFDADGVTVAIAKPGASAFVAWATLVGNAFATENWDEIGYGNYDIILDGDVAGEAAVLDTAGHLRVYVAFTATRGDTGIYKVVPADTARDDQWTDARAAAITTIAGDVAGLDGAAMRGTDGAYTGTPPTVEQIQSGLATSANQTTILNRLGAWTGSAANTILGALRALAAKAATLPTDIGGTYDPTTDSLEAIRDTAPLGTAMRGTDGAYTGTPPTVEQIQSGLATATAVEAVDTVIGGIAAKTVNLPANPAAVGSEMTLAEGSVVATLSEETYAEIAAALLGDGAHSVELFVKDDDTVYSNILVFTVDGIRGFTGSQGSVEFNLDDGTYTFYIRSSSLFTAESSYSVVIADGVITSPVGGILEVESTIIPSAVTPNSVIVYSDEYNPNGVSLVGAGERNVYVVSMETNRYSPEYLSHFQPLGDKDTAITTDANGRWYTEFPAESTIIIRIYDTVSGKSEGWKFTTPSSGSCSLWQLSPVPVYLTQR